MAAYAALVSVMQILDQLERHPSPLITLDKQQVESLTQIVSFLQEFLDGYNSPSAYSDEADPLEMRIADAAYAAEDVIESYVVDVIKQRQSTSIPHPSRSRFLSCIHNKEATPLEMPNADDFYQGLQHVIEEMDLIKKEVMEMKREETSVQPHQQQINRSVGKNSSVMVGFDAVFDQLLEKLTSGSLSRQVIPITGMGGIGKTTLARNIFENGFIKEYFHKCAWVTISQQYNMKEIICQILSQLINGHKSSEKSGDDLGKELYQNLYGKRYLIIMDDVWHIEMWEKMKFFLGDGNKGSRVIITTRLSSYLKTKFTNSYALDMEFLDEVNSWNLFIKTISWEEIGFPLELVKTGKKIVKLCRGLPLSIVVIGGLLAKSRHIQEHWDHIEQKLNSIVNSENDEYCLKVLKLSYNHLPAYLKPCFLYMGIFEEDKRIRVSNLIWLWISEGFLKPKNEERLEIIGRGFLKELVDRNLIIIDEMGSTGNMKNCKMHDLLRDLCLKVGEKERFFHVMRKHISHQGIHNPRRLFYPQRSFRERVVDALKSMFYLQRSSNERVEYMSNVRSLTSRFYKVGGLPKFRLLRILNANETFRGGVPRYGLNGVIRELANVRYLAFRNTPWTIKLSSSVNFLWNLHTLQISADRLVITVDIWEMSQLRHVYFYFGLYLTDLQSGSSNVILENLETLKIVMNFKCGEEVVNRIPNIRKLRLVYGKVAEIGSHDDYYCLRNFEHLRKLESLYIFIMDGRDCLMQSLTFPNALTKLTLRPSEDDSLGWEEMLEKIGSSLPHLQKLVLKDGQFTTGKWETVEGRFPSLKFLKLWDCLDLEEWMMEDCSHFPYLEKLHLVGLDQLEEIPEEIGNIGTLQSVQLKGCSEAAVKSAKKLVEEQEESQGEQLSFHVRVQLVCEEEKELLNLASTNFKVEMLYD